MTELATKLEEMRWNNETLTLSSKQSFALSMWVCARERLESCEKSAARLGRDLHLTSAHRAEEEAFNVFRQTVEEDHK